MFIIQLLISDDHWVTSDLDIKQWSELEDSDFFNDLQTAIGETRAIQFNGGDDMAKLFKIKRIYKNGLLQSIKIPVKIPEIDKQLTSETLLLPES